MGTKGKIAFATYKQTQVYLKPLLRKLKTNTLPEDIFESLGDIIKHLLNKNYIEVSYFCVTCVKTTYLTSSFS